MNPLSPSASLLCKLGSGLTHTEEFLGPDGHLFDKKALESILADPEVLEWMAAMRKMALLPAMRKAKRGAK